MGSNCTYPCKRATFNPPTLAGITPKWLLPHHRLQEALAGTGTTQSNSYPRHGGYSLTHHWTAISRSLATYLAAQGASPTLQYIPAHRWAPGSLSQTNLPTMQRPNLPSVLAGHCSQLGWKQSQLSQKRRAHKAHAGYLWSNWNSGN